MKTTTKKNTNAKTKPSSSMASALGLTSALRPLPFASRNSIRHHFGFWSLDFDGQRAVFDHEQGTYYVAYLLLNPPSEPIHGMALDFKAKAHYEKQPDERCETLIADPETGKIITLGWDAALVERYSCVDEGEGLAPLRRKIEELEAILDNDNASEPVKAEVQRELEELYAYQKKNVPHITEAAQKAARTVRMALHRFHKRLAAAVDPQGNPHPVLQPFAAHLEKYLLIPSARYSKSGPARAKTGVSGCFTYEPPPGVEWTA